MWRSSPGCSLCQSLLLVHHPAWAVCCNLIECDRRVPTNSQLCICTTRLAGWTHPGEKLHAKTHAGSKGHTGISSEGGVSLGGCQRSTICYCARNQMLGSYACETTILPLSHIHSAQCQLYNTSLVLVWFGLGWVFITFIYLFLRMCTC